MALQVDCYCPCGNCQCCCCFRWPCSYSACDGAPDSCRQCHEYAFPVAVRAAATQGAAETHRCRDSRLAATAATDQSSAAIKAFPWRSPIYGHPAGSRVVVVMPRECLQGKSRWVRRTMFFGSLKLTWNSCNRNIPTEQCTDIILNLSQRSASL